ncbi:sodium/sulfate symporter, putative [Trypanosoma cruzi]|uniref:Low-affinity phosphate transporter PHO91 n=2 Tax=Trypanosoma cruzi TaxID=5693 RepID=A0A2V2UPZ4_TRYCR|nr:sodium/sulfate symporter, putative [Trypanosoma cruzi]KAF8283073.1 Low-affinity phosphate transporter PHO91 [Trypanosoma cruzi]PBJ69643.1 phosphate transporter [Trypanosoma cruzi cruzi]PWU86101.1 Low-affinity phosphate transporter PHO91 [Trypanosoma cruzi]RNF16843.1 putative sodium/sulfate symporter [Trypanosoma cruzi]
MKFGKRFQEEMVEQWRESYVNYKALKQLIYHSELSGVEFSRDFFAMVTEELEKAEGLFQDLLDELQQSHDELLEQDPDLPVMNPIRTLRFYRKRVHRDTRSTNGSGDSEVFDSSRASSTVDPEPGRRGCIPSVVKSLFLLIIGDSHKRAFDEHAPRAKFAEWHSSAHKLQHFAELNLEAVRKAAKKLKKHRRREGDFTIAIEAEINRSRLVTLMPRLRSLMADIDSDYERKFGDSLDQYKNVAMQQAYHAKWQFVFLSAALFCLLMFLPILSEHPPAHNCVALFGLIVSLWITEAIPFFCTAMLIPIVAVPLGIIADPHTNEVANSTVASGIILGKVMDHVQILVLGGLTIGKALARTNLEAYAATALYRLTAHRPPLYLLGVMLWSGVLCAFVSNVAAPLLVLGVIQRTLWEFPEDTEAPHGILLGLAFACNIGGMLSPIASPQNAVAMNVLRFHSVSFAAWIAVALPIVLFSIVAAWAIILVVWKPFKDVKGIPLHVVSTESGKDTRVTDRVVVVVVSLITIILWIISPDVLFGDTGVVALIPIVVFFGTGILAKEDFNTLSWHLMFLLAGGNMLGLCAHDSKMLDILAHSMHGTLVSQPPYLTFVLVILVVALATTFVSHTVSAMILLPIIAKIGFLLPKQEGILSVTPAILVMLSALMCSGAMAFPISSFPNVNSLLAEDSTGQPYLKAKDFLFCGTLITLLFLFCLVTWMLPLAYVVLEGFH